MVVVALSIALTGCASKLERDDTHKDPNPPDERPDVPPNRIRIQRIEFGCNSETDVSRGALAGEGDDIVRDGDFSTIGVGE